MFASWFKKDRFKRDVEESPTEARSLREMIRAGQAAVIDVREPSEFAIGHIHGARNMPLSGFRPENLPHDAVLVFICRSGVRAHGALRQAVAAGFENVRLFPDGLTGWRRLGEALTK